MTQDQFDMAATSMSRDQMEAYHNGKADMRDDVIRKLETEFQYSTDETCLALLMHLIEKIKTLPV